MYRGVLLAAAACAVLMAAAEPALASGTDSWTQWAASPQDTWIRSLDFTAASTLVASSDGDGVFQAPSAVGPWAQSNGGLSGDELKVFQVVASGGQLYAATSGGLFTAPQGGGTWTQLGAGPGNNTLDMGGIQSVVVSSPSTIVVAVAGAAGPGVYTTSDGGSTWTRAAGMPTGENIFYLATGTSGAVIYAAGDSGVWTSVDGGASWTLTADGIDTRATTFRVAVAAATPNEVWAATSSAVYKSTDGGLTWVDVDGISPATLPTGLKAAFLLAPPLGGQFGTERALVGTNLGVWATVDGGQTWGQMSADTTDVMGTGVFGTRAVYALGLGFTPPSLLAGTQGFGVYSLPLAPVTAPGSFSVSPSSGLGPGDTMSVSPAWSGTLPIFYTYHWRRCPNNTNCADVASGGTGSSYTIPNSDANTSTTYQVRICAINLVAPSQVCATSNKTTGGVAPMPGSEPVPYQGNNDTSISPDPNQSYPWGTTFTINNGHWGTAASPGTQITPFGFSYFWERCDSLAVCTVIPGATGQTYTTTVADVGDTVRGWVSAFLFGGPSSQFYLAGQTFTIIEQTPVNTALPMVVGTPYVGTTLQSTAGAWSAHDPAYTRRWLECNDQGLQCQPLMPSQTGSTYTLTPADLGSTLELEVTATQHDPSQDRVTVATSNPTAVVTNPPSAPAGSPPPTPTPTPTPSSTPTPTPTLLPAAPSLTAVQLARKGKQTTLSFKLSGAGSVTLQLQQARRGHKVKNRCLAGARKHAKSCTFIATLLTIRKNVAKPGAVSIVLPTTVRGRRLAAGRYLLTLIPADATGRRGRAITLPLLLGRR